MPSSTTPSSLPELLARVANGEVFSYLHFWGHTTSSSSPDCSCLSQWHEVAFEIGSTQYLSAEQWLMASKARLFGDGDALNAILTTTSPREAKVLGRSVRGYLDSEWQAVRRSIALEGNLAKFSQNSSLRGYLLQTHPHVLVEASPDDRIWGIGLGRDDRRASDPRLWRGENLLGFVLVDVRAALA